MTLKPITEADFQQMREEVTYYHHTRWEYYQLAIKLAQNPTSVLELGAYKLPLFPDGDVMDLSSSTGFKPTYHHDACKIPWPIKDKQYDLFIALQVWEHLKKSQAAAFKEVMRISNRAILSFPFQWDCKHDPIHHAINYRKIARWTCRVRWRSIHATTYKNCRLVYYWEF